MSNMECVERRVTELLDALQMRCVWGLKFVVDKVKLFKRIVLL